MAFSFIVAKEIKNAKCQSLHNGTADPGRGLPRDPDGNHSQDVVRTELAAVRDHAALAGCSQHD